jgi:DHA2 family multidrug resistance protein-like MFS transporter
VRDSVASGVQVAGAAHAPALLASVRSAYVGGMGAMLWVSVAIALVGAVLSARYLSATPPHGAGADPAQSEDARQPAAVASGPVG